MSSPVPGCPRCDVPVAEVGPAWSCPDHGDVEPLWRAATVDYEGLVEHLARAGGHPTYLPWPLGPGWSVTDLASVGAPGRRGRGTLSAVSGTSLVDGPVDVLVVSEDAGVGLGARVAGAPSIDPGAGLGDAPPSVRVRAEGVSVGLWSLSTSASDGEWDRSVLVGEAHGRWLWLVIRPASAVLLLRDEWILRDVSTSGPELVELPFGDARPPW